MLTSENFWPRWLSFRSRPHAGQLHRRGFFSRGVRRSKKAILNLSHRKLHESASFDLKPGPRLAPASTWAYQLQGIVKERVAQCSADVVVIDTTSDGNADQAFNKADVMLMQTRPKAPPKKVIAYMSIGEAEAKRFYWQDRWLLRGKPAKDAPAWLADLNGEGWEGNFKVRFWEPAWQAIIIDNEKSFLNRIIDAGFDGVYLDIIDAYDFWMDDDRGKSRRPTADAEMVAFVQRIAHHAREVRGVKNFAIVPQNGEPLLQYPEYRAAISAIGKEDILFKMHGQANKQPKIASNSAAEVETIMTHLRLALADRIPILAVEYLCDRKSDEAKIPAALTRMCQFGLVPHFGTRLLSILSPVVSPARNPGTSGVPVS